MVQTLTRKTDVSEQYFFYDTLDFAGPLKNFEKTILQQVRKIALSGTTYLFDENHLKLDYHDNF